MCFPGRVNFRNCFKLAAKLPSVERERTAKINCVSISNNVLVADHPYLSEYSQSWSALCQSVMPSTNSKRWIWRYAEETPFHGLSMAYKAFSIWEVVSWITMVIICVFATILQTVTLAQVYLNEPTGTSTIIRKNQTIEFPKAVLCINQPMDLPMAFQTNLIFIQSLLDNLTNEDINMLKNGVASSSLNLELLKIAAEMFRSISLMETAYIFNWSLPGSLWSLISLESEFMERNAAVNLVFQFIKGQNISLEKFKNIVAVGLCNIMRLAVSMNWFAVEKGSFKKHFFNICRTDYITSFTQLGLCVKLGQDIQFHNPIDFLQIIIEPQNLFSDRLISQGALHLDLSGRPVYGSFINKGNVIGGQFLSKTVVAAHVQSEYQSENLRRAPCSSTSSTYDCEMLCYAKAVENVCKCWPFSISYLKPPDIPMCLEKGEIMSNISMPYEIPTYKECLKEPMKFATGLCQSKCLPDCQYQQVVFLTDSSYYYDIQNNATMFTMTVPDFVYPLLVESLTKDWQSFLNEFGGNIGLWLGGSLLAIIHLPVFIIKCILGIAKGGARTADSGVQTSY